MAMLGRYRQALAGHVLGYEVQRIDTFATRDVWNHRGQVVLCHRPAGSALPVDFWAQRLDLGQSYYYHGAIGYDLDDKARTYLPNPQPYALSVLGSPAGQLLAEELLAIDSTYRAAEYYTTKQGGVLHFRYPDQSAIDAPDRHIYLVLDEQTDLPRGGARARGKSAHVGAARSNVGTCLALRGRWCGWQLTKGKW